MSEHGQEDLVRNLETALLSPNIPPEILQTLLNLAEFMEHDDKSLPIDIATLGHLAEQCRAFSKALRYRESEFRQSPNNTTSSLISIYNELQQHEAAFGILRYAQQNATVQVC
jgi:serine/threonine-protein kinase mTOR